MWVPPSPPQTSYAALNTLKNSKQVLPADIHARDREKFLVLSVLIGVLLFEALASPMQSASVPTKIRKIQQKKGKKLLHHSVIPSLAQSLSLSHLTQPH